MSEGRMESEERERRDEEMGERDRSRKRGGSHGGSEGNSGAQEEEHRDRSYTRRASASSGRVEDSLQQEGNRERNEAGDECNGSDRRFGAQRRSGSGARPRQRGGDTDTLYISNLPLRCGALELRRIFEEVGEVKDCRIVSNPVSSPCSFRRMCVPRIRESRGFAFLTFVDPSHAAVAIERFDNKMIFSDGARPVRVERAKRNKPHNPTPGLYKGPPGASIKYDKSGRLKPGFLPYYAVAPGASREFMPPHSPFGMDYEPGPRGHSGGRWADEREWGARGYEPSARYYDRMDYSTHGRAPPVDFRGANPGELPYDMRMERGYDMRGGRGGYDARGTAPYDRGVPVYDARGYDRPGYDNKWQQYEDPRSDGRYVGYCDYYGGNGASGATYDMSGARVENREVKPIGRERSRSRGRRERRRSTSAERHHRAGRR